MRLTNLADVTIQSIQSIRYINDNQFEKMKVEILMAAFDIGNKITNDMI